MNDIIINILEKIMTILMICVIIGGMIIALRTWNRSLNGSKENRVIVVTEDGKAIVYDNAEVYFGEEKVN